MKVARTVRRGADGKGLSGDTTCTNRQVYGTHGTSPAAYSTAVEQLSPKHRQAIRFRYFLDDDVLHGSVEINDERYEQISTVTGRKETTLRSDVRRALKHLRKLLAERGLQR